MRKKNNKKIEKKNELRLPLNPTSGNKSQSLSKFFDFMLIFFTLDGQFLARAAKCSSGKMNLHLSYRYRPP